MWLSLAQSQGVMSWLGSVTASVAYARFARSLTGRDELARFSYSEWLTLASLAHSHGCDEVGRERD